MFSRRSYVDLLERRIRRDRVKKCSRYEIQLKPRFQIMLIVQIKDKFWLKRQNSVTHSLPHARYMHSMCEFFGRIPDKQVPTNATDSDGNSKRGSSPHPTKRGKYPGVRAIMYIRKFRYPILLLSMHLINFLG